MSAELSPPVGVSFFRALLDLFRGRERWLFAGVFTISLISAAFETMGVASILPFMTLVLDPTAAAKYPALTQIAAHFGATTPRAFLLFAGGVTVMIVALGNVVGAINVIVGERFVAHTHARIARHLFRGYLLQPYSFHVRRDAPSLTKVLLTDVQFIVLNVMSQSVLGGSRLLVAIGILLLLLTRDPLMSITVAGVLGIAYVGIYRLIRRRQRASGTALSMFNLDQYRIAQEALGGVKDLQVLGREAHVLSAFERVSSGAAVAAASNRATAQLPRYMLEAVAFGGVLLVVLGAISRSTGAPSQLVPLLALYAFAGSRLMPALQQVFNSSVNIGFSLSSLQSLHADYMAVRLPPAAKLPADPAPALHFRDAMKVDRVTFYYDGAPKPALRDVSLVVKPFESIGLVGRTGSGKSTLADLILGLYQPTSGALTVDDAVLNAANSRAWRANVGYVSQQVFLANASVRENIAFGLPPEEIDDAAVRRAARMAQAEDYVLQMPQGFDTIVGERGVKLSGGQRQRIGIARALYHDPELLVFDEATSALDGLTEDAVSEAIRSLAGQRTIILIAHRLRTVQACDRIVVLDDGQVRAVGTYDELLRHSPEFRRLLGRDIQTIGSNGNVSASAVGPMGE